MIKKKCICVLPVQSQTSLQLLFVCVCVCVWCARGMGGCVLLAHVCDDSVLCGSHLLQGVGESRGGGGWRRVPPWQTFTTKPRAGSLSTRVPGRRALRPPIAATSRRRLGAPPGPAGWTPDPSPRDYVHASLGFMGAARGAREGLGGTSGFSEGVRFSPGLLSEL